MFNQKKVESFPVSEKAAAAAEKRGEEVKIRLAFIRHGERTPKGELTDYGRAMTKEKASQSKFAEEGFDVVKSMGSPAGPKNQMQGTALKEMGRSTETAHIYGNEIAELTDSKNFETINQPVLSFETLKNKMPYNHTEVYNSFLPENFNSLSDEEKAKAAAKAQAGVVDHLMSLDTPAAKAYKEEVAGAYSYVISQYEQLPKYYKHDAKVLMPIGVHSPMMEVFLQKALVRQGKSGEKIVGFKDIAEIGGEFNPSEEYVVDIETDSEGKLKPVKLKFASEARPQEDMYLDPEIMKKLSEHYQELHREDK